MSEHTDALAHQFNNLTQQEEADTLGMWLFLCTEILLFGGLFLGYAVYRSLYPEAWAAGSHHNDLVLGSINTGVLLVSSLTMALAVHAAEEEQWSIVTGFLTATLVLGALFLGIKFYEYYVHYEHHLVPGIRFNPEGGPAPNMELFMFFYFVMTGLHALHMLIGLGVVSTIAILAWRRRLSFHMPVEITGLYWHLVDIVWVFLFPLLYLIG
jgi:cytochrome c oxidase subunit 3